MKKNRLRIAFGVAAIAAAGAFVYYRMEADFAWGAFAATLTGLRWAWAAAAVLLILITYVVRAARWKVMLQPLTGRASLWNLTVATCIGYTAVVIFGRAGEPVRPYLIARSHGVPVSTQIAAWVVERILDVLMILLIFGAALTQVERSGMAPGPRMAVVMEGGGWLAGSIGALCLAVLVGLRVFRGRVRQRLTDALAFLPASGRERLARFLETFDQGMQATRERSSAWFLVLYTVLEWALLAAAFLSVFRSFPALAGFGLADVIIALGFVSFGGAVQLPGVGGGMQLAAVLVLTELYGIPIEPASGVALVLWVVNFVTIVPLGLALAFYEGVKWRNMREVVGRVPEPDDPL